MEELLQRYNKISLEAGGAERALYLLLMEYKDCLPDPPVDEYFHKLFRQSDITPSGKILPAVRYWLSTLELPQRYVVRCYPRKG